MQFTFDVDSMTLGEAEEFETITGLDIAAITAPKLKSKAVIAIVYLQQRRENPDYTLEDARKVKITDITMAPPDPTPPESADS